MDDAISCSTGTQVRRPKRGKAAQIKKKKKNLMRDLKKRNVELSAYLVTIGGMSEKNQPIFEAEYQASDDEILEDVDESEVVPPSVNSLAGDALRHMRRMDSALEETIDQTLIETNSHVENDKSQPSPSQDINIEQGNILQNLRIEEGRPYVTRRLRTLQLEISETQPDTPGDGNCFVHALADQTR